MSLEQFKDMQHVISASTTAEELKTAENQCKAEMAKMNQLISANKAIVKESNSLLKSRSRQLQTIEEDKAQREKRRAQACAGVAANMPPPAAKKPKLDATRDLLNF
eukprot:4183924-Pyramimonas_sp.AAC.1